MPLVFGVQPSSCVSPISPRAPPRAGVVSSGGQVRSKPDALAAMGTAVSGPLPLVAAGFGSPCSSKMGVGAGVGPLLHRSDAIPDCTGPEGDEWRPAAIYAPAGESLDGDPA